MKRKGTGIRRVCLAGAVLLLLTSGCGAASKSDDYGMTSSNGAYMTGGFAEAVSADGYFTEEVADPWGYAPASGGAGGEEEYLALLEESGRKTIRTANLEVQTLEFDRFVEELQDQVAAVGGYMEYANIYNSGYYSSRRSASYTLRIPQTNLDGFLDRVGDFGTVTSRTIREEDVTLDYVDTQSRIKTLQVEQERLLALLEKAETLEAIIALEGRLSEVRYSIESYTSRLRTYDNRITYSTVSLSVSEVLRVTPQEPKTVGERIASGWSDTMYDIRIGAQDFLVWVVVHLPYLLFWAVVLVAAVLLVRRGLKHRRERKNAKKAAEKQGRETIETRNDMDDQE